MRRRAKPISSSPAIVGHVTTHARDLRVTKQSPIVAMGQTRPPPKFPPPALTFFAPLLVRGWKGEHLCEPRPQDSEPAVAMNVIPVLIADQPRTLCTKREEEEVAKKTAPRAALHFLHRRQWLTLRCGTASGGSLARDSTTTNSINAAARGEQKDRPGHVQTRFVRFGDAVTEEREPDVIVTAPAIPASARDRTGSPH